MSSPTAPTTPPPATAPRRLGLRLAIALPFVLTFLSLADGRTPAFLSPTVSRTLYFKLPIDGTRFHWEFLDRRAFLAGELTLRIVNRKRERDQTIVIFRNGKIADGWKTLDDERRDSSAYFGFSTEARFSTAVGDSLILTLVAAEDLRGRGPYSQGTLPKGTWVATGTYTSLYGGTLNPLRNMVHWGKPPIAFMQCWDTTWVLRDTRDVGWMGAKSVDADERGRWSRRGVDGRECRSTL